MSVVVPLSGLAVRVLEDTEVNAILKSDDFQRFFDKTTRIVERILFEEEEENPFVDYTGTDAENNDRLVSSHVQLGLVVTLSLSWHSCVQFNRGLGFIELSMV